MAMEDSIFKTIKKLRGAPNDPLYTNFDEDLYDAINTCFFNLFQLGVGPSECFQITDDTATWNDFTGGNPRLNPVKTYIDDRTRLIFDPPQSNILKDILEKRIAELEWRLKVDSEDMKRGD